jgi:molybdopterin synthase sulfur carrier subunit
VTPPSPVPERRPPWVRVRLFASLRETAGWSEREVALPVDPGQAPCTPRLLWHGLALAPPTHVLPAGLRVAINQHFASPDTPLQPGDELAFLPPITGG